MMATHFRDYHLLFDEQADAIFDSIDIMAERVRKVGGTTIRSISHIGQLQTIEDDNTAVGDDSHLDGRQRPHSEDDTRCNNSM
jgi:DNA-binding ferritin-like protein